MNLKIVFCFFFGVNGTDFEGSKIRETYNGRFSGSKLLVICQED